MNLTNTYLGLYYLAIITFIICLLFVFWGKVPKDKILLFALTFLCVYLIAEISSYVLAKNHIRTHFINYVYSLNYFIIVYYIYKTSNTQTNIFITICFYVCIAAFLIEIIWISGLERGGGIFAIFAFFWTIAICSILIKQLFLESKNDFNNVYFWTYISIIISKIFSTAVKGFGDLMIENNLINTFIITAIISYLGIVISNLCFIYSFWLHKKIIRSGSK